MWPILFLIINCVLTKTIYYECNTDENCIGHFEKSVCIYNKCVDIKRFRRQIDSEIQMLGDECQSNDDCRRTPLDGTKICLLNQCQCSPGYVPVDGYRCIRDLESLSSNTQHNVKSFENEDPPGYGSACSTHKDCQHTTLQLECLHGTCTCIEGYVPLGKYLCYNVNGQGIEDSLIIESSTVPATTFFSSTREIDPYDDHDLVESLAKLGNACTNDDYCEQSVSQSHCRNGLCSCIDGYISIDLFSCVKDTNDHSSETSSNYKSLLGGQCSTNQNCQTRNAACLNNICNCPYGFYPIDEWNCAEDTDSSFEELSPITTTISSTLTTMSIRTSTTSTTTSTTTFSTTTSSTTISTTGILWWPWSSSTTIRHTLLNSKNVFHYRCLLNRQCMSVDKNSHCTSFGRCVCNIGYQLETDYKGQKCVRKITNDDDCD